MGSTTFAALALLLLSAGPQAPAGDRLYGRVVTAGGEVYEGYLRWVFVNLLRSEEGSIFQHLMFQQRRQIRFVQS